jgi:hypothetical protein
MRQIQILCSRFLRWQRLAALSILLSTALIASTAHNIRHPDTARPSRAAERTDGGGTFMVPAAVQGETARGMERTARTMTTKGEREQHLPGGAAASPGAASTPSLDEFEEFDVLAGPMPSAADAHEEAAPAPRGTEGPGIEQVHDQYSDQWMAIHGVDGVAIGEDERTGRPALLVYVSGATDAVRQQIPAEVEGYQVRVIPNPGGFHTLPAGAAS